MLLSLNRLNICLNSQTSCYQPSFLTRGSEIHRYGTRFNYEPERIKSNYAPLGSSFLSKAPIIWNKIKTEYKDIKYIGGFASKIKKEMINSYK